MDRTLRGLAAANSNAICPILRDARSVISRVARASRPFSPTVSISCFTYCQGYAIKAGVSVHRRGCLPGIRYFLELLSSR